MPVAIETVIIVIVVVSFAVLAAIIFALYWLWRLLLEDRRCHRMDVPRHHTQWVCADEGPQGALLGSRNRREVIVDERSRRMSTKAASACLARPAPPSRVVETRLPDVIVLDDPEPPPPYEAIGR